jgi:hypothetical protein
MDQPAWPVFIEVHRDSSAGVSGAGQKANYALNCESYWKKDA